ncbi:MAG: hypothetical protein Lokiarch_48950, partial [Candidatus Lokiarchaeum sp. GC14_75]
ILGPTPKMDILLFNSDIYFGAPLIIYDF